MRILLVNPATGHAKLDKPGKTYCTLPNGILYIAAVLEKHGYEVMVYDNNIDLRQPADFLSFKPDLIGFATLTGPDINGAIEQSIAFKKLLPGVKIVWGNVHASILPEQVLKEPFVDFVVIGAGEYTLLELVDYLEKKQGNLGDIKGIAYRENGGVKVNLQRPFIKDLNELPDPAWHLVDMKKYSAVSLNTSRGCPFRCTFCYNLPFHKGYTAVLPAERVISQMEHLKKKYNVKFIRFFEDNFTFDRKRLRRFCQLMIEKKLNVKWDTEARADLSREEIALMARAGCVSVGLGVETGSQRMLKFLCKGIDLEKMEKTFWELVKHKITPRLYLMEKIPTETVDDFNKTQRLIKRLDRPPYIYMSFVPYPGTPLFDYCVEKNLIKPPVKTDQWGDFTIQSAINANLSEVPDEMVNQALADFRKSYAWQRFRFMAKHKPAYFLSLFLKPGEFFSAFGSLVRNYLTYLRSSASQPELLSDKKQETLASEEGRGRE